MINSSGFYCAKRRWNLGGAARGVAHDGEEKEEFESVDGQKDDEETIGLGTLLVSNKPIFCKSLSACSRVI